MVFYSDILGGFQPNKSHVWVYSVNAVNRDFVKMGLTRLRGGKIDMWT